MLPGSFTFKKYCNGILRRSEIRSGNFVLENRYIKHIQNSWVGLN